MIFDITRAGDYYDKDGDIKLDIKTFEELKELSDKHDQERLIIDFSRQKIVIYDDYVE